LAFSILAVFSSRSLLTIFSVNMAVNRKHTLRPGGHPKAALGGQRETDINDTGFDFDIYASGEYSRMLEREWAEK
jgi:hypothetical protein